MRGDSGWRGWETWFCWGGTPPSPLLLLVLLNQHQQNWFGPERGMTRFSRVSGFGFRAWGLGNLVLLGRHPPSPRLLHPGPALLLLVLREETPGYEPERLVTCFCWFGPERGM